MGETLTQRRRVNDEVFRDVKFCPMGKKNVTVPIEKAPANYVPAAAVTRRGRALFGITGRKGHVGGFVSPAWKPTAQPWDCVGNCEA